ncbi:unnamed protein product [Cylicostephanus goldi]|uniref:Uncharacterized protein n=1 Tax=Cylicostephanus goldi TaxID=71465 RepID=A0A3P6RT63_CYLGO|nr:unnamed protein product [Cylicostephanus goldi]
MLTVSMFLALHLLLRHPNRKAFVLIISVSNSMTSSAYEDEQVPRRLNGSLYRNVINMDRSVDFSDYPAYR